MPRFFSKSIANRLVSLFLLVSLLPTVVIGMVSFLSSKASLEESAFRELAGSHRDKLQSLVDRLGMTLDALNLLAQTPSTLTAIQRVEKLKAAQNLPPQGAMNVQSKEYQALHAELDPFFRKVSGQMDGKQLYLISADGYVLYSTGKGADLGACLAASPAKDLGLGKLWAAVMRGKRATLSDFTPYPPLGGPAAFAGSPVLNASGELAGVVATAIRPTFVSDILKDNSGTSSTKEFDLVGEDKLMRSELRFGDGSSAIIREKADTLAVNAGLRGGEGVSVESDYRGEPCLKHYSLVDLKKLFGTDFNWALVSKIDEAEALAPIKALAIKLLLLGAAVAAGVSLLGYTLAQGLAGPIRRITELVVQAGEGNLTGDTDQSALDRQDELGLLAQAYAKTKDSLRAQIEEIKRGANILASSSTQISASIAEVTAGAAETAASVTETTATVEELRQTVELGSQKAKSVSENARQTMEISHAGQKATEQISDEMARISQQMEAIADSIMSLSEQSQSIGEIIATVDSIAEQSNILSVNASIEAAKAGEHGKGFSVVAQEIKNLAAQSKDATRSVRHILSDIQKATSAAVLATEQGNKAVESGAAQVGRAREAVLSLDDSIQSAAQVASLITVSSEQQLTGVEQLALSMVNIKDATHQNVDSMRQLEDATRSLKELGQRLIGLVQQYKV
ncbi:hypothetical protein JCM15519_34610 [Fundidesulfovibrio butyratiphilus]